MKLRLFLSILFVIATTASALHELKHVNGGHSASSCQVCIVDDHSVSADIVVEFKEIKLFKYESITPKKLFYTIKEKNNSYNNRAPPLQS